MGEERERKRLTHGGLDREGFGKAPLLLLADTRLSIAERLLWVTLSAYARGGESAYPSQGRLGEVVGLARENVNRALVRLHEFGYLSKHLMERGGRCLYELAHETPDGYPDHRRDAIWGKLRGRKRAYPVTPASQGGVTPASQGGVTPASQDKDNTLNGNHSIETPTSGGLSERQDKEAASPQRVGGNGNGGGFAAGRHRTAPITAGRNAVADTRDRILRAKDALRLREGQGAIIMAFQVLGIKGTTAKTLIEEHGEGRCRACIDAVGAKAKNPAGWVRLALRERWSLRG